MMELSPEDELRLNVLLANDIKAIRIDESHNILYARTETGEAKLQLTPNCKSEIYLKRVREVLSGHVLGSPGGYPIFLRRWTRLGQITASNLKGLLMLGEPEAVIAVVRSPDLTEELAGLAWWSMQSADIARHMLARPCIAQSKMGKELADFLVEFLPFEEEPANAIRSMTLVLQPGLLEEDVRLKLWKAGARKMALRVGFLAALPYHLPEPIPAHSELNTRRQRLGGLASSDNLLAQLLLRIYSSEGQTFLHTCEQVLKKPTNQEVVCVLLNIIGDYFSKLRKPDSIPVRDPRQIEQEATHRVKYEANSIAVLKEEPQLSEAVRSLFVLAETSDSIVLPIFSTSSAVGSVMRKKISPVIAPLLLRIQALTQATISQTN